jgi:signal transduction histidine kinase
VAKAMMRRLPTTARIALLAVLLSLAGSFVLLGFIRYATVAEHEGLAEALESALLLALGLSVALGVVSGWLIARFVGRRVEDVVRVADAVGAGDLSRRAPTSRGNDAFDHLARRMNAMLDRTETLMGELRLLTDSLAHDLRSPVQRLRARIERALIAPDEAQRDQLLSGVLVETDALMRILTTVMEIGRSEAQTSRGQFAPLYPSTLVAELVEMYEPLAEEASVSMTVDAPPFPPINAHRQLLAQALSNLIDNALHYGSGTNVTLFVADDDGELHIGVSDSGPGIASADIATARRRFGRLDAARGTPGAGLGLSLVEAVAHLHNGRLELSNNAPGLRAALVLPR